MSSPLMETIRHAGSEPHRVCICYYLFVACYANIVICVAIFHEFLRLVAFENDVAILVLFVGVYSQAFRTSDVDIMPLV